MVTVAENCTVKFFTLSVCDCKKRNMVSGTVEEKLIYRY